MKRLYLLIILFVVSCQSPNAYYGFPENTKRTTLERGQYCEDINGYEYFGECWIRESYKEENFLEWVRVLNMYESWNLMKQLNQDLKRKLSVGEITKFRANNIFRSALYEVDEITNLRIQRNVASVDQQVALRNQRIGLALAGVSQAINQSTNNTSINHQELLKPSTQKNNITGNFKYSYISGFNKMCVYTSVRGDFIKSVPKDAICTSVARHDF